MAALGSEKEKITLIDLLYRDLSRIDSFYAQIHKGFVREITKGRAESSATTTEIAGNAYVVQGHRTSESNTSRSLEEHIDPHDQRIIDLLDILDIPPLSSLNDIPSSENNLVLLKGSLAIRDYKTIKEAVPLLLDSSIISQPQTQNKKEARETKKLIESIFKLLPFGLELELTLSDNNAMLGMLDPDYMMQKSGDLLMLYGNYLPGEWYVLGVIDKRKPSRSYNNSDNDLRSAVDMYANGIREMYNSDNKTIPIVPILIFREVSN